MSTKQDNGTPPSPTPAPKQKVLEELSEKEINLIHGPIGIKLGGKSAPEIALSIIAQLVSETHNNK